MFVAAGGSGGIGILAADAYEPDDSYTAATGILVGDAPQEHTIDPEGDVDWVSFTVGPGWVYTLETAPGSLGDEMDTVLYLYDSDGTTQIAWDDDGGSDGYSLIEYTSWTSKTVYAKVAGYGGGTGAYSIALTYDYLTTGRITGRVTDGADGIGGVTVWPYLWDGEYWVQQPFYADTAADGTYELTDLDPGTYRVGFESPPYPFFEEYWNDKPDVETADNVTVSAGATTSGIDAVLEAYGRITGTVTDGVDPIGSVWVDCYWDDPSMGGWSIYTADATGADGTYEIWGLLPGHSYYLKFDHAGGEYLVEWYDNEPDLTSATPIPVASGEHVADVDAVLAPAGRIIGTVRGPSMALLSGVLVQAFHWDDTYGYGEWAAGMYTGGDGMYFLGGLPAGTYRVRFDDGAGPYPVEWWDNVATAAEADDIAVTAGSDVLGIDAVLGSVTSNTAPVAVADSYVMQQDTILNEAAPGVLENDTDADGDALTAVKASNPSHGSVTLNTNGSFTYTPTTGFVGIDTFTYTANDGAAASAPAGVTIEVNGKPTTVPDSYSVQRDSVLNVPAPGVLSNDTDPEDDPIMAVLDSAPDHGEVTLDNDGSFTYTPDPGFVGTDSFGYVAYDNMQSGNSAEVTIEVTEEEPPPDLPDGCFRIAGDNRYLTSIKASQKGFPTGAKTVVIATGANWPDALGGSALAGAVDGPLLLTKPDTLPSEVWAEIDRLDATKAYILGSVDAVSSAVEYYLKTKGLAVTRLGGANRYETARKVADETLKLLGDDYQGHAFVATGLNFPDATGAAPLAAALGRPILLANVTAGTVYVPTKTTKVVILGSVAAVPAKVETYLNTKLGDANVDRLAGKNRYDTAAMAALLGVNAGMRWDGTGIATGLNFPDALSGGAMLGKFNSVMLLTRPDVLAGEARTKLYNNRNTIDTLFIFGDKNAVSLAVEAAAKSAATVK